MLGHAERIESGCSPGYTVAVVRGKGNERLIVRVNLCGSLRPRSLIVRCCAASRNRAGCVASRFAL